MKVNDLTIKEIQDLKMVNQNTLTYSKEINGYICPDTPQIYYFEKGYKPDIFFKAFIEFEDNSFEDVTETISKDTPLEKELLRIQENIIEAILIDKFQNIIHEQETYFKEYETDEDGYVDVDKVLILFEKFDIFSDFDLEFWKKFFYEK